MSSPAPSDRWKGFFEGLMTDFWQADPPLDGAGPEAEALAAAVAARRAAEIF